MPTFSEPSLTNSIKTRPSDARRSTAVLDRPKTNQVAQSYQTNQQLKYLHLQAEVEVLLQQLQTLKQRRLVSPSSEARG